MKLDSEHLMLAIHLSRLPVNKDKSAREISESIVSIARTARALHRLYEHACNRELSPNEKKRTKLHETRVRTCATWLGGIPVIFNGDPRGAPVRLVLPTGETNDFGGEGWVV